MIQEDLGISKISYHPESPCLDSEIKIKDLKVLVFTPYVGIPTRYLNISYGTAHHVTVDFLA